MAFDFQTQLKIGERYEKVIDGHLAISGFRVASVRREHQKMGIDRFIRTGELWVSAEYKTDIRAGTTGNIFVETHIKDQQEKLRPGWACKCLAQLLLILIPARRQLLWCEAFQVKLQLEAWLEEFGYSRWVENKAPQGEKFWGRGILVPQKAFIAACYKVERIECEELDTKNGCGKVSLSSVT